MSHVLLVAFVLLAAPGSAGAYLDDSLAVPQEEFWPSWLSEEYTDGTIALRYPRGWIHNDTRSFGHVLSDNKSPTAAFVGIRYLPRRSWANAWKFAEVAARRLRPPHGRGTTILRAQAARLGGRQGVEATVMWQVASFSPLGPTMRVFGIELESGKVAFVTLAAESPTYHNISFAWIKKSIEWR